MIGQRRNLRPSQFRPEPKPFDGRARDGGAALHEQRCQTRAESWQTLKQENIGADADHAADEKQGEGNAGQSQAKRVGPERERNRRDGDAPEVRLGAAEHFGGARGADRGDRI